MKLCLLIATAVAIATCYALPVPKEEVFAVYPVNSALAQHSSDLPIETKPEQVNSPVEVSSSKDLAEEKKVTATKEAVKPAESNPEELKTVPEMLNEKASVNAEVAKPAVPVEEVKSAPLKEPTDGKPKDAPVTVATTETVPTTVTNKDETRLEVTESVVAAEPKIAVPETLAVEPKLMEKETAPVEKSVKEETKVVEKEKDSVAKLVENVKVEDKKEEIVEVKKNEQTVEVAPEVKAVTEEKTGKLAAEPKTETKPEPSQARSTTSDLPVEQTGKDVKPEVKVTDQVVVKVAVEPAEEKKPVVEETKESSAAVPEVVPVTAAGVTQPTLTANDPEPQTEGKEEAKPTKVRAAPIVEGLKVSQPVEAEPAVTKIHVTVIQEEVQLDSKSADQKEVLPKDVPVTEAEEKSTEAATTTPSATTEKVVKNDEKAVEKASTRKEEVTSSSPSVVQSVQAVVETKPETAKPVDVSKEESAARLATTETVVVVVPSVKDEDVTTVVAVAENTDKPAEKVTVAEVNAALANKPAPEVRSAVPSEELPQPATTAKAEEQQAKAVEGSSKPGASERSDTVKEDAKDQSDSISTTVSSVTEQDTTTVSPVTTTEPELVPTPAKQKAKKQVPPNLKGYSKRLKLQEAQRKQGSDNE
uniref:Zonadhesin n=1 Tax=Anopheles funestus TaxID=62324 RepID=A0A4Y0BW69_ANOFN